MQNNQEIIHELKCKVCGIVCGTITFPHDAKVDPDEVDRIHETHCDKHDRKPDRNRRTE